MRIRRLVVLINALVCFHYNLLLWRRGRRKNYVLYQPDSFLEVIKSLLIIPLAFQGMTHVVVQLGVPLVHTKSGHEDWVFWLPVKVSHVGFRPVDEEKGCEEEPAPLSPGSNRKKQCTIINIRKRKQTNYVWQGTWNSTKRLTFGRNIHGSIRSQPIDKSPLMARKVFSRRSQSPLGKRDWRRAEMERQSVTEPKWCINKVHIIKYNSDIFIYFIVNK